MWFAADRYIGVGAEGHELPKHPPPQRVVRACVELPVAVGAGPAFPEQKVALGVEGPVGREGPDVPVPGRYRRAPFQHQGPVARLGQQHRGEQARRPGPHDHRGTGHRLLPCACLRAGRWHVDLHVPVIRPAQRLPLPAGDLHHHGQNPLHVPRPPIQALASDTQRQDLLRVDPQLLGRTAGQQRLRLVQGQLQVVHQQRHDPIMGQKRRDSQPSPSRPRPGDPVARPACASRARQRRENLFSFKSRCNIGHGRALYWIGEPN